VGVVVLFWPLLSVVFFPPGAGVFVFLFVVAIVRAFNFTDAWRASRLFPDAGTVNDHAQIPCPLYFVRDRVARSFQGVEILRRWTRSTVAFQTRSTGREELFVTLQR